MEPLIDAFAGIVGLIVGAAIWAVLFVVILHVLKEASPFTGWTRYVIAACVSLLSVIAMFRMFGGAAPRPEVARNRDPVGFLLLPYAAMGISMLILLLLTFFRKRASARRHRICAPEARHHEAAEECVPHEGTDLPHHYSKVTGRREGEIRPQGKAEQSENRLTR